MVYSWCDVYRKQILTFLAYEGSLSLFPFSDEELAALEKLDFYVSIWISTLSSHQTIFIYIKLYVLVMFFEFGWWLTISKLNLNMYICMHDQRVWFIHRTYLLGVDSNKTYKIRLLRSSTCVPCLRRSIKLLFTEVYIFIYRWTSLKRD